MGVAGRGVTGLFYGDSKQLMAQAVETVVCIGWNVAVGGIIFYVIGKFVGNRVSAEVEVAGLDVPEMGVPGYPEYIPQSTPEEVAGNHPAQPAGKGSPPPPPPPRPHKKRQTQPATPLPPPPARRAGAP